MLWSSAVVGGNLKAFAYTHIHDKERQAYITAFWHASSVIPMAKAKS